MYTDSSKGGPEGARRTAREGMGVSTKREQVESAGRCYQSRAPGEICHYPGFEYCPAGAEETPEETVRRYFAPYETLPARQVWLGREPDPAAAAGTGRADHPCAATDSGMGFGQSLTWRGHLERGRRTGPWRSVICG